MKTGTKSVLFGAHCWCIHPFALAWAWNKLYGPPLDPRLWVAFFVHDLGYIGKEKMDDELGESHPILGAKIMGVLFGQKWHDFTLLHSRFYAKKLGRPFSRLCVADKIATGLMPPWLWVPMATASGEIHEYMDDGGKYGADYIDLLGPGYTKYAWFNWCKWYMFDWTESHKHEAQDPT